MLAKIEKALIFVLVDLALEFYLNKFIVESNCGFNPCFSGFCSRISQLLDSRLDAQAVSILVLIDLAHDVLNIICTKMTKTINMKKRYHSN